MGTTTMGGCAARETEHEIEQKTSAEEKNEASWNHSDPPSQEENWEASQISFQKKLRTYKRKQRLGKIFDLLDVDFNGTMDEMEFYAVMKKMGKTVDGKPWDMEANMTAMNLMDADNDNAVSQEEFVVYFSEFTPNESPEKFDAMIDHMEKTVEPFKEDLIRLRSRREVRVAKMQAIFEAWDMDGGFTLDRNEIAIVAFAMYPPGSNGWTEEMVDKLFARMDVDENGEVTFDEFLEFYK